MVGVQKMKKYSIVIPCYNEEKGIGFVIDQIPHKQLNNLGFDLDVLVIDNNSNDNTALIARSKGVRVIKEPKQGKGYAILKGFANLSKDCDIVVMIDGDASYDIKELPRLLEPLENNFGDVIIGTRLNGRLANGSMKGFNRFGNWFFTFLARVAYKTNVTDVCSGFFAWKRNVVDNLVHHLESNDFSIEMEMIAKMARMNYSCYSVPVSYNSRNGKSNLKPIKDGFIILHTWFRNLNWHPKKRIVGKTPVINKHEDVNAYTFS